MQALKIAIGSSLAIYIANLCGLKYSLAAGSVALLTMVTTKWKTVKLSVARVVTFIISVLMALIIFSAVAVSYTHLRAHETSAHYDGTGPELVL